MYYRFEVTDYDTDELHFKYEDCSVPEVGTSLYFNDCVYNVMDVTRYITASHGIHRVKEIRLSVRAS